MYVWLSEYPKYQTEEFNNLYYTAVAALVAASVPLLKDGSGGSRGSPIVSGIGNSNAVVEVHVLNINSNIQLHSSSSPPTLILWL